MRPAARAISALAAVFAALAAAPRVGPAAIALLTLVPQAAFGKMHLWTLLTAALVEPYPPNALATVPAFFALARWVEPLWGSRELVRFFLVIALSAGISTLIIVMTAFYVSGSQLLLYVLSFTGFMCAMGSGDKTSLQAS
jgi:hypothetical protein